MKDVPSVTLDISANQFLHQNVNLIAQMGSTRTPKRDFAIAAMHHAKLEMGQPIQIA